MPRSISRERSVIVELSHDDIDPSLRKLQEEWEELLMHDELTVDIPPKIEFDSEEDKHQLMALWFDDGVLGWKIDYPNTSLELKCYRITKSRTFLGLYTVLCFMHICAPFFESPLCPWQEATSGNRVRMEETGGGKYLSSTTVNLFSLLCVLVYLLDIGLRLFVNHSRASSRQLPIYKDSWTLFRLFASCFLLLDLLVFFATATPIRFARALIPFVYISRRNSMRQLMHGLLLSFSKAVNVLMFYLALLGIWSFVGFIVFRKVENDEDNRFLSLPVSFLTCLHALTARSYNAFVANEYFVEHAASGVFFVSLLIFGDLLCTNLVVAVGNRQYRIFATRIFNRQLRNRRQAFVAIHEFLSDRHGYISRATWLSFCSRILGKYSVNPALANLLFSLECDKDTRKDSARDTIEVIGMFRLCALLSARVAVDPLVAFRNSQLRQDSVFKPRDSFADDAIDRFWDDLTPGKDDSAVGTASGGEVFRNADGEEVSFVTVKKKSKKSQTERQAPKAQSMQRLHIGSESGSRFDQVRLKLDTRLFFANLVQFSIPLRDIVGPLRPFVGGYELNPFEFSFRLIRVLLAVQLVFISGFTVSREWWKLGWFLEGMLWLEMVILMYAWGHKKYMRRTGFGLDAAVNVASLIFMCIVGDRVNVQYSAVYMALLVVQVLRFLRVLKYLRDSELFMSIFPLVLRMFFLLFSVIYFFAVFGHTRLCNAFKEENIDDNVDDDSGGWKTYKHVLNFNTLLQTVYTLFQVSILGNWSVIMDAAAHTERVPSLLFFFTYRMCMAMAVIPLLFAFIMQAFIARRNQDAAAKRGTPQEEGVFKSTRSLNDEGTYRFDRYHISTLTEAEDLDTVESRRRAIEAAVENIKRVETRRAASSPVEAEALASPPKRDKKPSRRSSIEMNSVSQSFQAIAEGAFFREELSTSPPHSPSQASSNQASSQRPLSSSKAVKVGEKSASMMSFWSGGETAAAPEAAKDKSRVQLLNEMLEEALHQLALQKEACRDATERNSALRCRIDAQRVENVRSRNL